MQDAGARSRDAAQFDWLQRAVEAAGDAVYEWDVATDGILWAGRVCEMFGFATTETVATGNAYRSRIHPDDLPTVMGIVAEHMAGEQPYDSEYRMRGGDGNFVWVHDRGTVVRTAGGSPLRLVGSLRLITARKLNEARLERLASFDELTGHFNKIRLRDALHHAIAYGLRYDVAGAFLVVGVDKLALINSAFGHETGDAVLLAIGQRLDRCLRASDIVGRIDADRFGVILGRTSPAQMALAAERILRVMREQPVETAEGRLHVTVSVGGVILPEASVSAHDILAKAETALKQAKQEGRDRFVSFRSSGHDGQLHRRNLDIGAQVQRALRDERLVLAYQPVVDARGHQPLFYECLLRLQDEQGELVPAGAFVPIVEQLGLIRLVDRYALDLTVRQLHEHPGVNLAVNISGLTASDPVWLRALRSLVDGKPDLARRLIIEITETAALHDIEQSASFVAELRTLGCRVAVDDFGAGFTSFKHLRALTVDIVKIDGSFVRNLSSNVDNQLFVRNLLSLADAFGLETVAEGVETAEDVAVLVDEGVHYLQGYYFGAPSSERQWLQTSAGATVRVAG